MFLLLSTATISFIASCALTDSLESQNTKQRKECVETRKLNIFKCEITAQRVFRRTLSTESTFISEHSYISQDCQDLKPGKHGRSRRAGQCESIKPQAFVCVQHNTDYYHHNKFLSSLTCVLLPHTGLLVFCQLALFTKPHTVLPTKHRHVFR